MSMDKPVIYFLPGTMCDSRLWQWLWPYLEPHFSLVHVDLPVGDNIEEIVESLAQQLPLTSINLLGFSLGGYLASAFAVRYPKRLDRLCVLANSPNGLSGAEVARRRQTIHWVETNGYAGIPSKKINQLLHRSHRNSALIHNVIAEMDRELGITALLQQLKSTTQRVDLSADLVKLSIPVTFSYGDEDDLVDLVRIKNLSQQNKLIQSFEITCSGHMLPLEQAEQVSLVISKWMSRSAI